MLSRDIEERIGAIAVKAARDNGTEFVHLEVAGTKRNPVVRVFADKEGGITIEDCSNISRAVETAMDADDFIPGPYVLEVSSPGLDRELYSLADFEKFTGRLAKLKLTPGSDEPRSLNGLIAGVEGDIVLFDDKSSGVMRVPYSSIAKANLKIDLHQELNRGQ